MRDSPQAKTRIFTYDEALATFPAVRDLTAAAVRRVESLMTPIQSREEMAARQEEIDEAYRRVIQAWSIEIRQLGCEVKGLWLVDWDSGDGYYCWQYPEQVLAHFHGYDDGFDGRMPIV